MPFFGDTLGAYMLPRVVLELLQQPGGQQQCGVRGDSGFAWLLSDKQLYVWRYREGKEARLRVLTLPRQPTQPCTVALLADSLPLVPSGATATSLSAIISPHTTAAAHPGPAAADSSLTVAVCDADGRLTVWLDAHHLAAPVEHLLLISPSLTSDTAAAAVGSRPPLVSAFTAARLDLGSGPAFLATLSAADGSLHLVQGGAQGIFSKQLVAAPTPAAESRGLVGALGSVLSRALTDAFEPSSRYLRKTPAARPAVALHLAPAAAGGGLHYRLLVLTQDSLDCWTIRVGLRPSETLMWSFANCLVRQHDNRRGGGGPVNLDLAVGVGGGGGGGGCQGGGQHVAVWMTEAAFRGAASATAISGGGGGGGAGSGGGGGAAGQVGELKQHVVQLLELLPEGGPAVCGGVQDLVRGYEEPLDSTAATRRRLLYSGHSHTCLLARWEQHPGSLLQGAQAFQVAQHYPGGTDMASGSGGARVCRALWTWEATSGTARPLSDDPDTAAVDIAAGDAADAASRWVVLSATYGVMEIAAVAAAPAAAPLATVSGGLDLAAVIANLLDAVLSQAAAITAAGGNLQPVASGLGRRLGALGALDSPMGQSTLAHYSTQLLDLLPKQWAAGSAAAVVVAGGVGVGGGGGAGGSGVPLTVTEQLSDKESRHSLMLQCLALSGVLHVLEPEVLRVLIENSEKLAVVGALHRLQAHQRDTHMAGQGGQEGDMEGRGGQWYGGGGGVAAAAVALLSRLVSEAGQESSVREYEVLSPTEIFYARPSVSVGHFLAAIGRTAAGVASQAARGLGNPGDSALSSLRGTVRELGALVSLVISNAGTRREQLAGCYHLSCQEVAGQLGKPDWLAGADTRGALEQLAMAVLMVRPMPPSPPSIELSNTLYGVTDVLLTCFSSAVAAVTPRNPSARSSLLAAYRELFEVCEALAAADPSQYSRLFTHMATLPPEDPADPAGTALATYVFERLLQDGRPADLLDLPQQFHAGITAFLQSRQPAASNLLAVQLLKNGALADAAVVLTQTAMAGGNEAAAAKHRQQQQQQPPRGRRAGDSAVSGGPVMCRLGGPVRQLSLARMAARAAGDVGQEEYVVRQLRLLGLQSRLGHSPDEGPRDTALMLDEALAERMAHGSKWQVAWKAVYEADPWDEIAAARTAATEGVGGGGAGFGGVGAAGGGEEQWMALLAESAVSRAARACARSDTLGFGANVVDSAPLDQVARWLRSWAVAGSATGPGARSGSPGRHGGPSGPLDPRVERREAAVMAALRLGVEGIRGVQTARTAGGAGATAVAMAVSGVGGAASVGTGGLWNMGGDGRAVPTVTLLTA
ncbi:hypothetical protein VOLCADRAFT_99306 [Volvox carteri f. nagariensis]|uniref:Nucleoporin Nup133/Nup155-like N-terminal domain-containing protein n=1 Tax=Volvox carteri f. nagariensis TaxID=3068 RepID=D8UHH0_VOLCA|nr:uncharacterized protein VOLCADRAFT_99306 [Volvox carteri f. nagariensis]EFJ40851.1 hypothetical protein VOLCADRAFT_99306 [Volvox carteri f. nagariensis]|eukprot:XP_002958120.1 hypothetical protein VOLCADRAFT_99306 [Volvox carteri f. nagariensis]